MGNHTTVARELAPVGLRSRPKKINAVSLIHPGASSRGAASQPSGSKPPRHKNSSHRPPVARGFIPAGLRSRPKKDQCGPPDAPRRLLQGGRFAAQREQAPSPRKPAHTKPLWRGDLSPLDCAAGPKKINAICLIHPGACSRGAASQPSGDKPPRHKSVRHSPSFT